MSRNMKGASFAAALAASMALAGAASAATIYNVTGVSMPSDVIATLSVPAAGGFNGQVYLGQVNLAIGSTSGPGGSNVPQTISAFCIDLFHEINLGGQNLQYEYASWSGDFGGHPLSQTTMEQIDYLTDKYLNTTPFLEEAAQAAIWEKEVPGATVTVSNQALQAEIALLAAETQQTTSVRDIFTPVDGSTQSFNTAVPEPATWAMMILGSMSAGLGLRISRRRNSRATIAA